MPLRIKNLEIPAGSGSPDELVRAALNSKLELRDDELLSFKIRKKSLDARRKARIVYHYQVDFEVENEASLLSSHGSAVESIAADRSTHPLEGLDLKKNAKNGDMPVIVGSGPAGIFAAMVLADAGIPSIIVERGEAVEQRLRSVNKLRSKSEFSPESNYCYGEGGAGTFSDGKLTCGRNHPLIRYMFEEWVKFGAPKDILYEAHPHIGTDYLMKIALNMRAFLISHGCKFLFGRKFEDFEYNTSTSGSRFKVKLDKDEVIETNQLILAIGHSARETYHTLLDRGVSIAPKPFAIGARFEHPQDLINKIQFGSCANLPAAEYKLAAHAADRGIWTFCMCPGGHLLPTNAQAGHLAINGMSYHARNSGFANAAVVVNVQREDFFKGHPLDGVYFQEAIERLAFAEGGGNYFAPAQRITDFIKGRKTKSLAESTYKPGITSARLDKVLPEFVVNSLRSALVDYNKKMHGFLSDAGMVVGVETKTSSPVVMMRDTKTLQSVSHAGLFPAGEGAGFAGGIVSAALDGLRIGRAVAEDVLGVSSAVVQLH